jgi:hypothetical protein
MLIWRPNYGSFLIAKEVTMEVLHLVDLSWMNFLLKALNTVDSL